MRGVAKERSLRRCYSGRGLLPSRSPISFVMVWDDDVRLVTNLQVSFFTNSEGLRRISRKYIEENGQGGIRTHDTREGIPVFETGSFSHSDTCPKRSER